MAGDTIIESLDADSAADEAIVAALRRGDEQAFMALVERYQASLLRLALMYVDNRSVAEDVVQETWIGVLRGIESFEGRSSLKTWIFRILTNRAKTWANREQRSTPFSSLLPADDDPDTPAVEPERFYPPGHEEAGWWVSYPKDVSALPEERLLALETRQLIEQAIDMLPPNQRAVITLRDVEGWDADEVCNILNVSATNQRVLLHRARARVSRALEAYLDRDQVHVEP